MEEWVAALKESAAAGVRPIDGTIALEGFPGEVTITTDQWGVPHVAAPDRETLYAAQGYLHATERLWQIEFTSRIAQGRLSELVGEPGWGLDRFFRTIGLARLAKEKAAALDDRSRGISRSYFAGFTAGARSLPSPVEYQILAAEPEMLDLEGAIERAVAFSLLVTFGLSLNWSVELLRFQIASELGPERTMALAPFMGFTPPAAVPPNRNDRGAIAEILATARRGGAGIHGAGSNNWVLSGRRTTTGMPLLCNDPHLLVQMPAIWMEMHLRCPDLNVTGVSLPGLPGIIIGHNDRVAWGFTNTGADVSDLYLERLSEDGRTVEYDGKNVPVQIIEEHVNVRNEAAPRVHEVRVTRHGPILTDLLVGATDPQTRADAIGAPLALRWVHADAPTSFAPVEALNEAHDWESFRAAAFNWPASGQNMVYADVDGHIGYQFTGTIPIRKKGAGVAPLPGWEPSYEWAGTLDPAELPFAFDPDHGFLATANNRVVDLDYPHYLTNDWEPAHRIRRISDVLSGKEKHSPDDLAALQADTHSGIADELIPLLTGAKTTGHARAAHKMLAEWDRRMDAGSAPAALFGLWLDELAKLLFKEELGPELFDFYHTSKSWVATFSTEATIDHLRTHARKTTLIDESLEAAWRNAVARFGEDTGAWRWGVLHRVTFVHTIGRALPPLAAMFNAGPY
ncbi:MAG: penicillin acylase family protein, partial [Actinobacteria bacterium]|nr:penicillin acylase family protein [Actinomycetota bacterium]